MNIKTTTTKSKIAMLLAVLALAIFGVLPIAACAETLDDEEFSPERDYYIVTFDSNGGSAVKAQNVYPGQKVIRPVDPIKSGKVFVDWYKDDELNYAWNFVVDTVSADMTLHAAWRSPGSDEIDSPDDDEDSTGDSGDSGGPSEQNAVTVTFNVGRDARLDGASNPPSQTVSSGSKINAPIVIRPGYTVSGWYVEDGSTKWNFDLDTLSKNTTLFARWAPAGSTYTPLLKADNTLYIHYRRPDGKYTGWHAWVWPTGANGSWYESATTDESGTVFSVDLSSFGGAASINFLIAKNEWEAKDGEANNTLVLNSAQKIDNSYHWYVDSGSVASGRNYLANQQSSGATTEALRASKSDVNRSTAQNLPVQDTVSGWDETGIGYQIFVASFCDSNGDGFGDIQGIISKLDYLDSLNVDVLWLTPIQSSNSSHGYDCYDYYSVDPKFGTNADYRELVYKAHQKGIKVIMDLVVNHTSPDNEWFIKSKQGIVETVTYQDGTTAEVHYRDFYRWKNSGGNRYYNSNGWYFYSSFGDNMPELNYDCQQVRDAMVDVASYWMSYGLDGFRMDAIKHVFMWDESDNLGADTEGGSNDRPYNYNLTKNVEFFKEFNYRLKTRYPNCFLLGEQLSGNVDDVSPFYAGMDSLFDFNTYYDLPGKISGGNASGQASVFNSNATKYANHRTDRPINSMITSNHDIMRLADKISDEAKRRLYVSVLMTMPGLSWIYYGDEMGLSGGSSTDNNDQRFRQPMKWTSSWANVCNNIPNIYNYNANNSLSSVENQLSDNSSFLSYVMSLTAVRDDYPALINGTATCSESNGVLKIEVRGDGQTVVSYHNFSSSNKSVSESGNCVFGSANLAAYGTVIFVK